MHHNNWNNHCLLVVNCCVVTRARLAWKSVVKNLNILMNLAKSTCMCELSENWTLSMKADCTKMAEDIRALRRASNSDEICQILARIEENLRDLVSCDQYVSQGLLEILRGVYIRRKMTFHWNLAAASIFVTNFSYSLNYKAGDSQGWVPGQARLPPPLNSPSSKYFAPPS